MTAIRDEVIFWLGFERRRAKTSVAYEHGLDADGELVHIADAERGGRYSCAGCGKRLIAVLGDERSLSFRHRSAADGDACEPEHAIFRMAKLAIVAGWRAAKANGWEYPIVMPRESCQTDALVLDATDFDHADDVNPDGRVREPCRKTADLLGRVDIRPKWTIVAPLFPNSTMSFPRKRESKGLGTPFERILLPLDFGLRQPRAPMSTRPSATLGRRISAGARARRAA